MLDKHQAPLDAFSPRLPAPTRQKRSRGWLRSRDREQLRLDRLRLDVNDLRQQIASLATARALLFARTLRRRDASDGSAVRTVIQYLDMLRHGFHDELWSAHASKPVGGREYLHAIMAHDLTMGRLRGLESFNAMWERYTRSFVGLTYELVDAQVVETNAAGEGSEVIVVARSTFDCSLGESGLVVVFPHLEMRPELRNRVRGQTLRGSGVSTIAFDSTSLRIVRFDMTLDLVGAFLRAVKDPVLVAEALRGALITPDYCIGDVSAFEMLSTSTAKIEQAKLTHNAPERENKAACRECLTLSMRNLCTHGSGMSASSGTCWLVFCGSPCCRRQVFLRWFQCRGRVKFRGPRGSRDQLERGLEPDPATPAGHAVSSSEPALTEPAAVVIAAKGTEHPMDNLSIASNAGRPIQ